MAVELATAYVSIVPSTRDLAGNLTKQLVPEAEKAGEQAGDKAGSGFSSTWKKGVAAAAAAAGAALVAGFMQNINAAEAGNKLTASLGLTDAESARAGEVAGDLFVGAYGDSIEHVNEAVGSVMSSITGMRGASEADLKALTANALDFAGAFEVDVSRAAAVAGIAINSGLAKDGAEAFDLLTAASQKVPASMREDLLDATEEYGQFFSTLGFSGEEAFAMLAGASEQGMYGIDKTGDALKEFTIRATDMSSASVGAFEAVGLDANEMANAILTGGDTARDATQQIVDGLLSMKDPSEQANTAIALFGTPLEDLNASEIPAFLQNLSGMTGGLGDVSGAADAMGDTLNQGPGVALEMLKRTVMDTFGSFVEWAMPALVGFAGFLQENQWVIGAFGVAIGVVLVGAFISWAAAVWAANAALLANPITWIVLAIVALIAGLVLLIQNWDTVAAWLVNTWGGVVQWVKDLFASIGSWFQTKGAEISAYLSGLWTHIKDTATNLWNGLLSFIKGIPGRILAFFTGAGTMLLGVGRNIVGGMSTGFRAVWTGLSDFIRNLPRTIINYFSNARQWLVNAGRNILAGFLRGLVAGFDAVKNFVGGIGDWIARNKGPKAYDLKLLTPAGGWIMEGLEKGLSSGIPGLKDTLGDVANTVSSTRFGVDAGAYSAAAANPAGYPSELVIRDTDGSLIGRMRVEAGRVQAGAISPLSEGMPAWA